MTWTSWQRISPRSTLSEQTKRIRGCLWQQDPAELPMLVVFSMTREQQTVWSYDFTKDSWEVLWESVMESGLSALFDFFFFFTEKGQVASSYNSN